MTTPCADLAANLPADSAAAATNRPPTSAARLAANRRNAQKSTGPRTEAGKAQSRRNAVKHGLAGDGICLPTEDESTVRERCLTLHEEMAPSTVRGMMLVETIARAHVRMQRAARQEVAVLSHHQRHAVANFDDARLTIAEDDVDHLSLNTATRYRHLIAMPEGIDLLIARLQEVRREVRNPFIRWNYVHGDCLERFCGRIYHDRFNRTRGRALSLALEFDPSELTDDDRAAIEADFGGRIKDWAIPAMEAHIDGEIARLEAHQLTLDHAALARDRTEAAARALFDAGRDASLARRYEAAATRTFFRALKEFDRIEANPEAEAEADGSHPPSTIPSALDEPSRATAEVLAAGDALAIVDPADRAEGPPPPRRSFERPVLASSGITAEQASAEISYPHYSRPPVPVHQPIPPLVAVLPPLQKG